MPVAVLLPLDTWQNFYVIVGTAAATLTGLMFVVIQPWQQPSLLQKAKAIVLCPCESTYCRSTSISVQ